MIVEGSKPKVFRVHAKRFFLTYSQVPYSLMPESVISQFEEMVDFSEYVIDEEYHADGGKHLHAVLVSSRRHDVRVETLFDTEFGGKTYVSHCQMIKNLNATIRHVCKENSYITSLKNLYNGELLPVDGLMRAMANQEGIDRALEYYDENHPHLAVGGKSLVSMERYLSRRKNVQLWNSLAARGSVSTPFEVWDFRSISEIESWLENDCRPTLIMVGPAGCRKTQFVKALAAREDWKMLRVNHKEALKWLTDEYDTLFSDNFSVEGLDDDSFLALVEQNDDRTICILHSTVYKRGGLIQILALNRSTFLKLSLYFARAEFLKRCGIVHLSSGFTINRDGITSVQINISNHNNIYNN